MQSVSSRIWTRVAVSISYDDNHYTTGTSTGTSTSTVIVFNMFIFNILSAAGFKTPYEPHILRHVYHLTFRIRLTLQLKDFSSLTINYNNTILDYIAIWRLCLVRRSSEFAIYLESFQLPHQWLISIQSGVRGVWECCSWTS